MSAAVNPSSPAALVVDGVSCSIPLKGGKVKVALKDVSASFAPNSLTAILGPSGSGKTILLDTIASGNHFNSKRQLQGTISVHGETSPAAENRTSKVSYLTHRERLLPVFTVRETLMFTAHLMSGVRAPDCVSKVNSLIEQLGLTVCADTLITRLSGGQRRRTAVAVELMNDTRDILIMDEPTSGLDAHIALELIKCLIELVAKGRTFVFTMHQPTSEIAALLTNVMILTSKGTLGFIGSKNEGLDFLSSIGYHAPHTWNPLDFFVEVVSDDFENRMGPTDVEDISKGFASSKYGVALKDATSKMKAYASGDQAVESHIKHRISMFEQFYILMKRTLYITWRNPGILKVRTVMYIVVSLFLGLVFLNVGRSYDDNSIYSRNSVLFFVGGFYAFMSVTSVPFLLNDRHVYISEKRNGLINPLPFTLSQAINMIGVTFILALVTTIFIVPMVQLRNFGVYLGLLWIVLFLGDVTSSLAATVAPNFLVGLVMCCAFWSMAMMVQGFFIDLDAIPAYFQWVCWITPMSYSYQSFMLNEYSGNVTFQSLQFPTGQSVLDFFGYGPGGLYGRFSLGDDVAIVLVAFAGGFLCLFYSVVRWVW